MVFRYVHSMESQQTCLIKALQKVHRHVRQSVEEEDMKEIVDIVRACGFDFESVPLASDQSINQQVVPAVVDRILDKDIQNHPKKDSTNEKEQDASIDEHAQVPDMEAGSARKRKRNENDDRDDTVTLRSSSASQRYSEDTASASENTSNSSHGMTVSDATEATDAALSLEEPAPKRQRDQTDDCWNFNYQPNAVTAPYSPWDLNPVSEPYISSSFADATSQPIFDSISDSTLNIPTQTLDDSILTQNLTDPDTLPKDLVTPELASPLRSPPTLPDWDATLWWDPAILFNMDADVTEFQDFN